MYVCNKFKCVLNNAIFLILMTQSNGKNKYEMLHYHDQRNLNPIKVFEFIKVNLIFFQ